MTCNGIMTLCKHRLIHPTTNCGSHHVLVDGMGWDGIDFGYGVATALMIVHWPTAFLPKHSAHRVGRVIPEKNHHHGRSRSNPTIVQYSDFGKEVAQVNTVSHPVGA